MIFGFYLHVIFYRNSDFFSALFKTGTNWEFEEIQNRKLLIPEVSDATIGVFIDIMYGKDFNSESYPLLVIKELLVIGGVYDPEVQEVVAEKITPHLDNFNVLEMLKFCKLHRAREAALKCMEYLMSSFDVEITSIILNNVSFHIDEI